jgi:hypothetical protein
MTSSALDLAREGAAERDIPLREIKSASVIGYYFIVTDKSFLAGKLPGTWIDIHLSIMSGDSVAGAQDVLASLLKEIVIEERGQK